MRKFLGMFMVVVGVVGCLFISAAASNFLQAVPSDNELTEEAVSVMRATGSFNIDVKPNSRAKGDTDFPLEAGETVRIRATYSPEDAKVDFGLVDPDGIFHYLSAENGIFDKTFEIPESGNYRLGIKNNSGQTIKVSGFVRY